MGNRIPEELIEKIQRTSDIVDVVSEYVQLKKQGRNYFGLCPFHGEKSPSFSVSADKQIFHCFGCGAGGNVFSFLMQHEGYAFIEAAQHLADKANIEMPSLTPVDQVQQSVSKDAEKMIEAHELLKKFYHHLLVNTKEGQQALDYLLNRGFTKEIIDTFEIGYALDSWDFISKFLVKRGFDGSMMEEAGLLVKKNNSDEYFDRFRNRIMFPIADHHGMTIAFSGRVLGDEKPKYLNSPETKIFNKSKLLYNFHRARVHIRKNQQAILFEGFADVISSTRSGVQNAIATMGTSLTDEQAKIIRRNVSEIIICYDSDSAGIEATVRASKILKDAGCRIKVAMIPDGLDPDDYIKKFGSEKFKNDVIGASVSLMTFKMSYYRRGKNLQNEGERLQYIENVILELSKLESAVEKEIFLKQISREFDLSMEVLKDQLHQKEQQIKPQKASPQKSIDQQHRKRAPIQSKRLLPAFHTAERMLIGHMLRSKDFAEKVLERLGLQFNIEEHKAIVTYLYGFYEEGNEENVSSFLSRLPSPELQHIVSNIAMITLNTEVSEQELSDYIKQVLNHQKMLMIKEKEAEKNEAERNKQFKEAAQIAMEIIQLNQALKS
ncbi:MULTISPECIES: DNA primase [Metabacillus]|uniref:DNA primase n=2 Tax=Metabacillus TaxID=2675233 RepID=A0A179SU49_9BACI|nr:MULTISPECIES: DNA primase [Metabacillus]OAS85041.1 DNA primase [Metabacillus litoralis]QNF26267.1 DNA primase [Metabacillus sp. KUDC1714]